MRAGLFKLLNHLHFIAGNMVLVQQIDVLNMAIVKHKIMNIVIMNLAGLIDDTVAGFIQISFDKSAPLVVVKLHVIKILQLRAHVGQHGLRVA